MEILRKTENYHLNEGNGQARGLYNVSTNDEDATGLSHWFDEDTKDDLLNRSESEFDKMCALLIKQNDY